MLILAGGKRMKIYAPAQITDLTMVGVNETTRKFTLQWTAVGSELNNGTGVQIHKLDIYPIIHKLCSCHERYKLHPYDER